MSIQIITDFNTTSKLCYCGDETHGECYVEGRGGDNIRGLAQLMSSIIIDMSIQIAEDPELTEHFISPDDRDEQLELEDQLMFCLKKKIDDQIGKALAAKALERKMKSSGMDEKLSSVLSEALTHIGWEAFEKGMEKEGDEE